MPYEWRPDIPKKLCFKNWAEIEEIAEENLRRQREWWRAGRPGDPTGRYHPFRPLRRQAEQRSPQRRRAAVNRKNAYESESEGEAQATAKTEMLVDRAFIKQEDSDSMDVDEAEHVEDSEEGEEDEDSEDSEDDDSTHGLR
ncbi:hypothetical protein NM208_g8599 [Fusarium decemcellulare]|uniref:Uncharacterized protein n=1 Tax=Fusarium decemcellulare TaxID=57161 RepID=A0ACC1S4P0_9HYPO|nr:hypothetical protein NM208_g8599 [Fusarium decemcellulare]